jgi:hypothetical protein
VGMTSVEAVSKDPVVLGEVHGMNPTAASEVHGVDPVVVSETSVVDPVAIGEVVTEEPVVDPTTVGEATTVQAWRRSRSGRMSGGEMIVARVRVYGWVASHLKRRIVMTGGIDYVNTPIPKVE